MKKKDYSTMCKNEFTDPSHILLFNAQMTESMISSDFFAEEKNSQCH